MMKIEPSGKFAIIFARVWGIIAILFGLFLIVTIIDSLARHSFSSDLILTVIVRLVFSALFILAGLFFLRVKLNTK